MDVLQNLLDSSPYAFVTALVLGLMTAISPCPLATNLTAIGYISRDLSDGKRVFYNGLLYTLGRAVSYTLLAVILYLGADKLQVSLLFQGWGEKLLGPVLLFIGLTMLDVWRIPFPGMHRLTEKLGENSRGSSKGAFFLGMAFALAFCPYSGVLYFAILIPLTISTSGGLYLPLLYALATGLPVVLFAWMLAFAIGNVGNWYRRIQSFEVVFRKVVAVVFLLIGLYLTVMWLLL